MAMTLPAISSITQITSAQLAWYAGQAESFINAKISKHYALPFATDVPLLTTISTDLALYNLLVKRLFTAERMNKSEWPDRYKEAMAMLDDIASGKIVLIDSSGSVIGARNDIAEMWTNTMRYVPTFHDGAWEDMVTDPSKLDDIDSDRSTF